MAKTKKKVDTGSRSQTPNQSGWINKGIPLLIESSLTIGGNFIILLNPTEPTLFSDPVASLRRAIPMIFLLHVAQAILPVITDYPISFMSRIWRVFNAVTLSVFGVAIFHVGAVLFGAPLYDKIHNTFFFAIYLSFVSVFPASCVLQTDTSAWMRVFIHRNPQTLTEKAVYYRGVFSVIGAWMGAFVIPLDWDRPWQVWPIPSVLGACIGQCLGILIGCGLAFTENNKSRRTVKEE